MAVILFPNDVGGIAVIMPSNEMPIEHVAWKDVPAGKPFVILDKMPSDWMFSQAWTIDFSNPHGIGLGHDGWAAAVAADNIPAPPASHPVTSAVDMVKARNVWRDEMRSARASKFTPLDAAVLRAIEDGAPTAAIVAQKKALRDVTADPRIEAAQTIDELRAIWPACLG